MIRTRQQSFKYTHNSENTLSHAHFVSIRKLTGSGRSFFVLFVTMLPFKSQNSVDLLDLLEKRKSDLGEDSHKSVLFPVVRCSNSLGMVYRTVGFIDF